jgi:hypothetical protein
MPRGGARPGAGRKPKHGGARAAAPAAVAAPSAAFAADQQPDTYPSTVHRFKPGQSGNPAGRPALGASIREWMNIMGAQGLTEAALRAVSRDVKAPMPKRAAAIRLLRTLEVPDVADFEDLLTGDATLKSARKKGVRTDLIKKIKTRTRTVGMDADENPIIEVERELELYDRSGEDFDRVVEQTDGRPRQTVGVQQEGKLDVILEIVGMEEGGDGGGGGVVDGG